MKKIKIQVDFCVYLVVCFYFVSQTYCNHLDYSEFTHNNSSEEYESDRERPPASRIVSMDARGIYKYFEIMENVALVLKLKI